MLRILCLIKSKNSLVATRKIITFATITTKFICDMKNAQNKYDITSFEDEGFVKECLEAFDENVTYIEKDYSITSKKCLKNFV